MIYFSFSAQLTKARNKILRLENELAEKQKCITKYKSELHSQREQAKKDIRAKGTIINSLQKTLCALRKEAKEAGAKDAAIIKVRFVYTQ
jgi:predicted RNase H-like nuclease (RuvC/YqgF family)